ncbi:hypothetical protein OHC33_004995 [Knufia fluminis]|uniref:Cytochrome P450 n=1 Tax=Knufia fluminis TaxID=191047 RepID=A0AAN8F979_9EURO|nr:hypothetical protein OHC33_004995 [Knufia fluminis]
MATNTSYIEVWSDASYYTSSLPPALRELTISQALFCAFILLTTYRSFDAYRKRANVPGVGFSSIPVLSSWIAAYRFTRAPLKLMTEGVTKYKPGYFRIATIQGEYVMVTDRNKVQEFLRQPDDVLSFQEAVNDQQQIPFTMGWGIGHATYHNQVVRVHLTKSLENRIEDMVDETRHAFDDLIGSPTDYQPIHIYKVIAMSVARISNRVMVGKEFSENTEFLELAIAYAEAVVISAELIRAFPDWMKHILIRITPAWSRRWKAMKHLKPMLEKRLAGDFDGGKKPDDLMQWLMDAAPPGEERTIPKLVERIMSLNVASIHTTTMTFTGALYKLAAEPEKYMPELRAELEEVLAEGPLSKDRLAKLKKMDSFLRESARYNNAGLMAVQRNAKKQFTFSDGTVIPAGAKVGTPTRFLQRDPLIYDNPEVFDGFRFSRLRDQTEGPATQYQMVSTAPELHVFGHGKHACPGRFFAVTEMKLMFAELITRYDMKLAPGTGVNETFIATTLIPDTKLNIMMKARS